MKHVIPIAILAVAALMAGCGITPPPASAAPGEAQWIRMGADAEHRASLDESSVRGDQSGRRSATYAADYNAVQGEGRARYDREQRELQFDCATETVRVRKQTFYLESARVARVDVPERNLEAEWTAVAPGTFLANAMAHVCDMDL